MEKKRFSIVKKFPIFAIISLILIAPGLIGLVTLPFGLNLFNMDVDFVGGTSMTFNLHTEVTSEMSGEEIPQLVEDACGVAKTMSRSSSSAPSWTTVSRPRLSARCRRNTA